ncbi:MAG: hypothetical protein ACYS19_19245, partial [Planctomycetota bacterium]
MIIYTTVAPEEIINLLSRQKTKEQQAPNIALFSLANHYNCSTTRQPLIYQFRKNSLLVSALMA